MSGSKPHSIRAREAVSRIEGQRHGWDEGDLNDFAIIEEAVDALGNLEEQLHSTTESWKQETDRADALQEQLEAVRVALRRIVYVVEAWDNDETPDEDFPFDADMDFVNFCGHVARAALTSNPARRPKAL